MSKVFRTQSDGAHSVGLLCFQSEWVVRLDSTSGLPTTRHRLVLCQGWCFPWQEQDERR